MPAAFAAIVHRVEAIVAAAVAAVSKTSACQRVRGALTSHREQRLAASQSTLPIDMALAWELQQLHSVEGDARPTPTGHNADMMKVFVRIRPQPSEGTRSINIEANAEAHTIALADGSRFSFHKVFDGDSDNAYIFGEVGQPLVRSVLEGFNGTLLAYGQTGIGKVNVPSVPSGRLAVVRDSRRGARKPAELLPCCVRGSRRGALLHSGH